MKFGLKQFIKNSVYTTLGAASLLSGVTWMRNRARREPVLRILMYHKINDLPGNTISVPPDSFRRQLQFLKQRYTVITPAQLGRVIAGAETLPPQAVLLTFDDGYHDNYENAYPILKEFGLTALLFLATDFIGADKKFPHDEQLSLPNPTLNWAQVRQMREVFTIGSHGQSHRVLTQLSEREAVAELNDSKRRIEAKIGERVEFFSYPKGSTGDFDDWLEDQVLAAGYVASFITIPASNSQSHIRACRSLRRYNVEPFSSFTFACLVDGSCDFIALKDTALGQSGKQLFNRALGTTTR